MNSLVVYVTAKSLYCVSPDPCGLGVRLAYTNCLSAFLCCPTIFSPVAARIEVVMVACAKYNAHYLHVSKNQVGTQVSNGRHSSYRA